MKIENIIVCGILRSIHDTRGCLVAKDYAGQIAFWEFYGDGPVDCYGRPIVVYHGTSETFSQFNDNDDGIFFSQDPEYAAEYAGNGEGANIIPAYLQINNPYCVTGFQLDHGGDTLSIVEAKEAGYDGYIVDYNGSKDFAVFASEQVKSAIGSIGTCCQTSFDIDDSEEFDFSFKSGKNSRFRPK